MGGRVPLNFGQRFNPAAQARGGNAAPRLNPGRPLLPNQPFQFRPPNLQLPILQANQLQQLRALINLILAIRQQLLLVLANANQQQPIVVPRPARPAAPPRVQPAAPQNNRPVAPPRGFEDFWQLSDQTQRDIDAYRPRVNQTISIKAQIDKGNVEDVLKTVPDYWLSLITPRPNTSSMVTSLTAAVQLVTQTTDTFNKNIEALNQLLPLTELNTKINEDRRTKQQAIETINNNLDLYSNLYEDLNGLKTQLKWANAWAPQNVQKLKDAIKARVAKLPAPLLQTDSLAELEKQMDLLGANRKQLETDITLLNDEQDRIIDKQANVAKTLGIPFDDRAQAFLANADNLTRAIGKIEQAKKNLPKELFQNGLNAATDLLKYRNQIEAEWQRRRDLNLPDPGIKPAPPPREVVQADPPVNNAVQVAQAEPARVDVQLIPDPPLQVNQVNVNFQPDPPQVVVITPSGTPMVNRVDTQVVMVTPTPTVVVATNTTTPPIPNKTVLVNTTPVVA